MTAQEFNNDLKSWDQALQQEMNLVIRKVGLEMLQRVILKSPVDTGHFRHNWQLTVNNTTDTELAGEDKGGTATIARESPKLLGALPPGPLVYIQNPVPYAERLENGWSQRQAPQGMLRLTLQELATAYNMKVEG